MRPGSLNSREEKTVAIDSVAPDVKKSDDGGIDMADAIDSLILSSSFLAFIPSLWTEEGFAKNSLSVFIYASSAFSESLVVAALSKYRSMMSITLFSALFCKRSDPYNGFPWKEYSVCRSKAVP